MRAFPILALACGLTLAACMTSTTGPDYAGARSIARAETRHSDAAGRRLPCENGAIEHRHERFVGQIAVPIDEVCTRRERLCDRGERQAVPIAARPVLEVEGVGFSTEQTAVETDDRIGYGPIGPRGTKHQGWSAAAAVIGQHTLEGQSLFRIGDL